MSTLVLITSSGGLVRCSNVPTSWQLATHGRAFAEALAASAAGTRRFPESAKIPRAQMAHESTTSTKTPRNLAWRRSPALPQPGNSPVSACLAPLAAERGTRQGRRKPPQPLPPSWRPSSASFMRTRFRGYRSIAASCLTCTVLDAAGHSKALA